MLVSPPLHLQRPPLNKFDHEGFGRMPDGKTVKFPANLSLLGARCQMLGDVWRILYAAFTYAKRNVHFVPSHMLPRLLYVGKVVQQ